MLDGHSIRLQGSETRQRMLLYDVSFNLFWTFDLSGMPHVSYGKVVNRPTLGRTHRVAATVAILEHHRVEIIHM